MKSVSIIDYGLGNLNSVIRAFESCCATVKVVSTAEEILNSERLILPGVGAFGTGINNLKKLNIIDSISSFVENGRPFLGICLGMQLMLDSSEEFGIHKGLSLVPGKVLSLLCLNESKNLPHMGWIRVTQSSTALANNFSQESWMYFVHSYACFLEDQKNIIAESSFGNKKFTAVFAKDNLIGCQFHPEKSAKDGLNFIKSFLLI